MVLHHELNSEAKALLARVRAFLVEPQRRPPGPDGHNRAFTCVIRPLLSAASEAIVWPPPRDHFGPIEYPHEVLIAERGRYRFDLSRDVVSDYQSFWLASASRRGSIAIRLPRLSIDMAELFRNCMLSAGSDEVGILASRYQYSQCDSPGAIRYCDTVIDGGEYVFLCPASNGIGFLSIFAPSEELERLYCLAAEHLPPHQRWRANESADP